MPGANIGLGHPEACYFLTQGKSTNALFGSVLQKSSLEEMKFIGGEITCAINENDFQNIHSSMRWVSKHEGLRRPRIN